MPAFTPGTSANLTVLTTTASVALPLGGSQIRIAANGAQNVFVKFGGSGVTAVLTDMCILANTAELFSVSRPVGSSATTDAHTHVAAIAAGTGTAINVTAGVET